MLHLAQKGHDGVFNGKEWMRVYQQCGDCFCLQGVPGVLLHII
jgi:hypothetical protein